MIAFLGLTNDDVTRDALVQAATDIRIPGIIYGTAWKKEHTEELVRSAILLGFRGIDTACQPKHYNEPGVGAAIATCRKRGVDRADLFLQSKFTPLDGQDPKRVPYDPRARLADQVGQSFAASLRNLQTDYLDCLILHSPRDSAAETGEAWQAMEAIVDAGGARQLGISNCYDLDVLEALHRSARVKPVVVQNRFHAATGYDVDIRSFCRHHGIVYESFWTLTANPRVLADRQMVALAARYERTPAQVLFRYLTQEGVVPLTGTRSENHMREDLEIFEFELTESERASIGALVR